MSHSPRIRTLTRGSIGFFCAVVVTACTAAPSADTANVADSSTTTTDANAETQGAATETSLGSTPTNTGHADSTAMGTAMATTDLDTTTGDGESTNGGVQEPTEIAQISDFDALGLDLRDDLLFIAAATNGLQIFDISTPSEPSFVTEVPLDAVAYEVAVSGDYAFVADWSAGLQVVEISDPNTASVVETIPTPTNALAVAADPTRVVVGTWNADFENPDPEHGIVVFPSAGPWINPAELATPGWAGGLALVGDLAFVADGPGGLHVISLLGPSEVSTTPTLVRAYGVAVANSRAYVADNTGGLLIFDIQDPGMPVELGNIELPGAAYGVDVDDSAGVAWVACDTGGVQRIDVSDPATPMVLDDLPTTRAWAVHLTDSLALVADTMGGLRIFERPR